MKNAFLIHFLLKNCTEVHSCLSTLVPNRRVRTSSRNNTRRTMRYKRDNTLAVDVSSVPAGKVTNQVIHVIMKKLGLDLPNLKSLQVHSSRKIIYVEMPDHQPAAEIVAKYPSSDVRFSGIWYPITLTVVDEDIVDVRVRDVPPQTPNHVFMETLAKYGEVLSVTSETWVDFFPGIVTGVRLVRMKPSINIPSFVTIGNHQALVSYRGQIETCRRCDLASHKNTSCKKAAANSKKKTSVPQATNSSSASEQQQKQNGTNEPNNKNNNNNTTEQPATTEPMDDGDSKTSDDDDDTFTTVKRRRKGKKTSQQQHDEVSDCSSTELDDEQLIGLNKSEAYNLGAKNILKWANLQHCAKKQKISAKNNFKSIIK